MDLHLASCMRPLGSCLPGSLDGSFYQGTELSQLHLYGLCPRTLWEYVKKLE